MTRKTHNSSTTIRLTTALLAIVLAACGSKADEGKAVLTKLADFEHRMCACTDEACAKKVREEHDAYEKGGAMKKPTDEQMNTVMDTEHKIDACETRFVLSDVAAKELEQLKTGLANAKAKVAAGGYAQAGVDCNDFVAERFAKDYAAYIENKPDVKAFMDERNAYCKEGMHLEAATAAVTKVESERAASPTGQIQGCISADMSLAGIKLKDVPSGAEKFAPLKERFDKACAH